MKRKKYFILVCLLAFYSLTRFVKILSFPVFEDEASYLLFAYDIKNNPVRYFLPMDGGVEPLFSIVVAFVFLFFPDLLFAGRIVNIVAGLTIIFWFFVFSQFHRYNEKIPFFATLFFIFSPVFILNSRVANLDVFSVALFCWNYLAFEWCSQNAGFKRFLILFLVSLSSFLTKPVAFFLFPLLITNSLLGKYQIKKIITSWGVIILALFITLVINSFHSQVFITSASHLLFADFGTPFYFSKVKLNFFLTFHWLFAYCQLFFLPVLFFSFLNKKKNDYLLFFWFFSILIILCFFVKNYFPRHLLVVFIPFILMTAKTMDAFWQKKQFLGLSFIVIFLFSQAFFSWQIIIDPDQAVIAKEDHFQFFEDYTSGKEVPAIIDYFNHKLLREQKKIQVLFDSTSVYHFAFLRQYLNDPRIQFSTNKEMPSCLVFNKYRPYETKDWPEKKSFTVSPRHTTRIICNWK